MFDYLKIVLTLSFVLAWGGVALPHDYMVKKVSVDDGLSQSSVTSMLRDSQGFLWIGTKRGLNRYDYNSVKQYFTSKDENSISDNAILNIFEDAKKGIWIVTNNGLTRYEYVTDSFKRHKYNGKKVRTRGALLVDDGILFSAEGGNMLKYEYATDSLCRLPVDNVPQDKGIAFYPWGENKALLLTGRSGMKLFDMSEMIVKDFEFTGPEDIESACLDSRGNLWVSPFSGKLYCYDHNGKLLRTYSEADGLTYDMITCLTAGDDVIYVGGERGLDIIDLKTGKIHNNPFNGVARHLGAIRSIYISRNDNIYIGTVRNGLRMLQNSTMRTFTLNPAESLEKTVTSMISDGDIMWCGLDGNGIVKFDQKNDRWEVCKSTSGLKVIGLANWPGNKLLVSIYGEPLRLYDKATGVLSAAPAYLDRISDNQRRTHVAISLRNQIDGTLLAISDSVYSINPSKGIVKIAHSDEELTIRGRIMFIHSSSKRILVFWYRTVYEIDPTTMNIKPLLSTPTGEQIKAAQFDGKETLYFATSDEIYRHNFRTGETIKINLDIINNIGSIVIDENKLWIGASNRLFMVDNNKVFSFDEADGVVANEFLSFATYADSANIYMGGTNGLLRINRTETAARTLVRGEDYDLAINLAEITVNGLSAWNSIHDGVLELPAKGSVISLKVVCDESRPIRSKLYRFYLYGLGQDRPFETLQPSLTVSELPSGQTIKVAVSCSLPDGSWSTPTELLTLDIKQVWWQTWWFITLVTIGFIALVWDGVRIIRQRWRNASNQHRQHVLEREVQILANINESLKAPLEKVAVPINEALMLLDSDGHVDQEALADHLEQSLHRLDKMRNMVDSPFEMLHPQNLRLDPIMLSARFNVWLENQVIANLKAQRLYKRLKIDFRPDYDPGTITFDATRLEMIVGCLLSELIVKGVNVLEVTVTSDDSERMCVVMANRDAADRESLEADNDSGSLRMMYARWLAESDSIDIVTRFDKSGILAEAKMVFNVSCRHGKHHDDGMCLSDDATATDSETGGDDIDHRDLSECVIGVACCDSETADLIKLRGKEHFASVSVCQRGDDMLKWLRAISADIVVIDGNEQGMAFCRRIKSSDEFNDVKVLILTAGNIKALKEQSFRYGGDAYLEKPFDMNVLLAISSNLINEV